MKISEILIGPHQNIEFELMMAGQKPMAMVGSNEVGFRKMKNEVKNGSVKMKKIEVMPDFDGDARYDYAFVIPGQEWRIARLEKIYANCRKKDKMDPEDHIEIGKLLGYSDQEITAFLNRRHLHPDILHSLKKA